MQQSKVKGCVAAGDSFVKPRIREGVLPSILGALITARTATRAALKETEDPARRAVLDSRQKALKVTANALYGFTGTASRWNRRTASYITQCSRDIAPLLCGWPFYRARVSGKSAVDSGAQASPLQCVALADSCLALGAMSCKRAKHLLDELCASGALGPRAKARPPNLGTLDRNEKNSVCHQRVLSHCTARWDRAELSHSGPQALGSVNCGRHSLLPGSWQLSLARVLQGGRVIYGQTDSLFCHLPSASAAEAVAVAQEAAARVSDAFLTEMELKYERVCQPFMLLHVNRQPLYPLAAPLQESLTEKTCTPHNLPFPTRECI